MTWRDTDASSANSRSTSGSEVPVGRAFSSMGSEPKVQEHCSVRCSRRIRRAPALLNRIAHTVVKRERASAAQDDGLTREIKTAVPPTCAPPSSALLSSPQRAEASLFFERREKPAIQCNALRRGRLATASPVY